MKRAARKALREGLANNQPHSSHRATAASICGAVLQQRRDVWCERAGVPWCLRVYGLEYSVKASRVAAGLRTRGSAMQYEAGAS